MKIWPVILDSTPEYLDDGAGGATLLTAPVGRELLVEALAREIQRLTPDPPTIVAPPRASLDYRARLATLVPGGTTIVASARALADILAPAETSDLLLFLDPRCMPAGEWGLPALLNGAVGSPGSARHLVAYASDVGGTREHVNIDDQGLVRSVHRYYKPAAWPFLAGVAASLVPVSSGVLPLQAVPASLLDLRELFVSRGVPSHDVAITSRTFDLTHEEGLLAAVERSAAVAGGSTLLVGHGHAIDATARLFGPVVVHGGARIEPRATIVGPAVIGPRAVVASGAVLAQVVIGPDAVVPAGAVLRDRSWFVRTDASLGATPTAAATRRPSSFPRRLERYDFEPAGAAAAGEDVRSRWYPPVKHVLDAIAAAVALVVFAPLLALIAVLVRLDSPGPVFFRHRREGVGGRPFDCLKFRTMYAGANDQQRQLKGQGHDKMDGPHFKMAADPRITRIGRWLRVTNLDELPQLFNVLVGHMSAVGPRPSPFRENQICVPWREGRLSVRPGITGLWQVCRHDRDAGDFHQWIEYDLLYVQHMGPALDLKVMVATLLTLGGKYPVKVSWLLPDLDRAPAEPMPDPEFQADPAPGRAAAGSAPSVEARARSAR